MAIDKKNRASFSHYLLQKKAIESRYDWCKCSIMCQHTLICEGKIQPTEHSSKYKIRIGHRLGTPPKVEILEPDIQMTTKTHVYSNGNLCLYYPKDQTWAVDSLISETINPWTAEWLAYYELYLIMGKWEGPEVAH